MKDKLNLYIDKEIKEIIIKKAEEVGLKPSQYITLLFLKKIDL